MAELQGAQQWVRLLVDFDHALPAIADVDADFEAEGQFLFVLVLVDVVHQDPLDDFVFVGVHAACILMNHNDYLLSIIFSKSGSECPRYRYFILSLIYSASITLGTAPPNGRFAYC